MKRLLTYALLFTLSVSACTKHTNDFLPELNNTDSSAGIIMPQAKVAVNGNWVEYRIATIYEQHYAHWCQLWNSPLNLSERRNACGPTAYMLAVHMIAAAHGYSFMPSSGNKLQAIISAMGGVPVSMTDIASHASAHDSPPIDAQSYTTINRSLFKSFLESELADGNPVIVPIVINTNVSASDSRYTAESSVNYDIDSAPQSGRPNYIVSSKLSGGYGHFVVVVGIKIYTPTGQGYVYYKDPLAQSGTTKVCSYTRFLESAKINGSCTEPSCLYYDALTIRKQ